MWEKIATNIRKVASEVCGITKGSGGEAKNTWWWNEEVQRAIKEKKECYRCLYHDRSVDNIEKYKVAKKTTKRAINVAKGRAYEDLYRRLSTKEGEKDIYRMARARDWKTRDFNPVKCINVRGSSSWRRRMRSDIDGKSILINCSMLRTRTPPFSWTTRLMTLTDALCGGFKNRRS